MTIIEWRQMDDYYWAGPAGWTICRVKVFGQWQFELWQTGDKSKLVGHADTLDDAQAMFDDLQQPLPN